jgi:hypothetical protein
MKTGLKEGGCILAEYAEVFFAFLHALGDEIAPPNSHY